MSFQFRRKLYKSEHCLNCHNHIGNANFCSNCGQINTHKQIGLIQFFKDWLGDYLTFDSKFFRSLSPLLFKPGFLTTEYNTGRRNRYVFPLRLYIFTTFLFFLIISLQGKLNTSIDDEELVNEYATAASLYADIDSLDLADEKAYELARALYLDYQLKPRSQKRSDSTFPDSLKAYILQADSTFPEIKADTLSWDLYSTFRFYKITNKARTKPYYRDSLTVFLRNNGLGNVATDSLVARLTGIYQVKLFLPYYQSGNTRINFSADGETSSRLAQELEIKAERIFSRGSEGQSMFWAEVINQLPKAMFILMPIFAVYLKLLYVRKGIFYFNHLIFSLHIHSVVFIYLAIAILLPKWYIITAAILAIWVHSYMSLKNVYHQHWVLTFVKLGALYTLYLFTMFIGFIFLTIFTALIL